MAKISDGVKNKSSSSFPGKIAIISSLPSLTQSDEEIWSAEQVVSKYGADKVLQIPWTTFHVNDYAQVITTVASLAVDREIRALIINQALPGCNTAVEKLKRIRDDIFVVYCAPHDSPMESAKTADLLFSADEEAEGPEMVKQAEKQGAKTFVHYSFPRHMIQQLQVKRRELIKKGCEAADIRFVDAGTLDPKDDNFGAQQFIFEDVSKRTAMYGEDTAFFSTSCFLQVPLIRAVLDNHAIFPQPCCPSPYHGFPEALGIEIIGGMPDLNFVISEARRIAAAKNMSGRLSTWPLSASMMQTHLGVEYAIKWINGLVQKDGIDDKVLLDCMKAYIREVSGNDITVSMTSYSEGGTSCDNFKLLLMDYLNY